MVLVRRLIVETWRKIIQNTPERCSKSWVVFKHGTCVILMDDASSKEAATTKATQIISQYGPVYPGTPAGDLDFMVNSAVPDGMIVTGWHNDVLNFVGSEEGGEGLMKALMGRNKRNQDGRNPEVLHVEFKS